MKITWYVDDGYVGKDRPQVTEIDDEEFEYCDSVDEMKDIIFETISYDFESKISYYLDSERVEKELEQLLEKIKKEAEASDEN